MKKIKIISDKHPDSIKLAMRKEDGYISSGWYLHGELESMFRYDLAQFVEAPLKYKEVIFIDKSGDKLVYISNTEKNKPYKIYYLEDGIYDVEVVGCKDKCTGYFWTTFEEFNNIVGVYPKMHGLIVMNNDLSSVEYAVKKYAEKAIII